MKKNIFIIAIVIFMMIASFFAGYSIDKPEIRENEIINDNILENNTDIEENENNNEVENDEISENDISQLVGYPSIHNIYDDIFGKLDYPLIDIYFDDNNNWIILKSENLITDNPEFHIIKDSNSLEYIKEKISVLTFPVGRGTTEDGNIYIFKNDILVKKVPFMELYISDVDLENLFENVSKEEVEDLLQ